MTKRQELLKYLRHLCAREWPTYEGELVLPDEAHRLLEEAQWRAFVTIVRLNDPEAKTFVDRVYRETRSDPFDRYVGTDLLVEAKRLAPKLLERLLAEDARARSELTYDALGQARRKFISDRTDYDPFCDQANLEVGGLAVPDTKVRISTLDGSVVNEF